MNWEYIASILPELIQATIVTIRITLISMSLASLLGLGIALARMSGFAAIRYVVGGAVEFVRLTPLLVQLLFVFYVLPKYGLRMPAEMTGIIVLGVHYATYTSEVYRAGIDAVPRGQWEAAESLNMSGHVTWRRVVLPQAIPPMIPPLGNYLIAMLKDVPVLSIITVYELLATGRLIGARDFHYLEVFTVVGVIFLILSYPSSLVIRRLEARYQTAPTPM